MKMRIFAMLSVLAWGCGDDESGPSLVGDWVAPGDGPYDCAFGVTFEADGTYVQGTACTLEGGGLGVEVYGGTYTASDDEITLKQTHGTCPEAEPLTERLVYELDGDRLRLGDTSGTVVLSRAEGGDDITGQAAYGCYAQDGSFTPRPISPL